MSAKPRLHFVGIGGIGMSGIAEVFLNQGYPISGSDAAESESTRHLKALGADIHKGHSAEWVRGARCVVVSSAINESNPEWIEAKKLRIPVIPRAEMLGELMRNKIGIAVAGSHGKTTTTSMVAVVLTHAGLDPTLVIGGKVDSLGGNAKSGAGAYVVAEADESDGSFLKLPSTFSIITNIDNDHLDHYKNFEAIEDAFVAFVSQIPFYGSAIVCIDDPVIKKNIARFTKPTVTYGLAADSEYRAQNLRPTPWGTCFEVLHEGRLLGEVELKIPGQHNVLNAMAVIALGQKLELSFESIKAGLESFTGVNRRLQTRYMDSQKDIQVIDDYGHHPTEIKATLSAIREAKAKKRILILFQPHRYSRTLHCFEDFKNCFTDADEVWVTDIYAAGESPIDGIHSELLVKSLEHPRAHYGATLLEAEKSVLKALRKGDVLVCMGAGSITQSAIRISEQLSKE